MSRPALRLVDPTTGEVHDACPECQVHVDTIAGLTRKINGLAAENTKLRRDRAQEAREHPDWPILEALFDVWRRECGHPRSGFDVESFYLAHPLYARHGWDLCERAIAGAKFDPFVTMQKNGRPRRHDDWTQIFANRGKFESFANRAPRGFVARGLPERFTSAEQRKVVEQVGDGAAVNGPPPGTNGLAEGAVDA